MLDLWKDLGKQTGSEEPRWVDPLPLKFCLWVRPLRKAVQLFEHKECPHIKEPQEERSDDVIGKQCFYNKLLKINERYSLALHDNLRWIRGSQTQHEYIIGHPLMMESVQEMTGVSWRNSSLERWRATKWAPVWSSGAPSVERRPPRRTTCSTTLRESTSPTRSDTTVPTVPRHWQPRTPCQSTCTQPISSSSHSRWPSRTFPGSTASQASPFPLFPCLLFPCRRFPRQNREKKRCFPSFCANSSRI